MWIISNKAIESDGKAMKKKKNEAGVDDRRS